MPRAFRAEVSEAGSPELRLLDCELLYSERPFAGSSPDVVGELSWDMGAGTSASGATAGSAGVG